MGGYISEVLMYDVNLYLGTTEIDFLQRFTTGPCSAYKIWSELARPTWMLPMYEGEPLRNRVHILSRIDRRELGKKMAYKNVQRRVLRLAKLGLIEVVKDDTYSGVHKAKFYKITDKGIFYLMHFAFHSLRLDDLPKFKQSMILRTLLFPYFDDTTLKRHTIRVYSAISLYLAECYRTTIGRIRWIRDERDPVEREREIKSLMYELKQNAFAMAFKLIRKFNPRTVGYLARDKKFARLVHELHSEYESGFKKFVSEEH